MFLTTKFPDNVDYINKLSDPQMDKMQLEKGKKDVAEEISEMKEKLEEKFSEKYLDEDDVYSVRRAFYEKYKKKNAN